MKTGVMLDIETLGTTMDSPILEIGAIIFDEDTGEVLKEFDEVTDVSAKCQKAYEEVCKDSDKDIMHCKYPAVLEEMLKNDSIKNTSLSTLSWWIDTFDGHECWCRSADKPSQQTAVSDFVSFLGGYAVRATMYCKGMFDMPFIAWNLKEMGVPVPWKFWKERDLRTILAEHPDVYLPEEPEGAHSAITDCRYQLECLKVIRQLPPYTEEVPESLA